MLPINRPLVFISLAMLAGIHALAAGTAAPPAPPAPVAAIDKYADFLDIKDPRVASVILARRSKYGEIATHVTATQSGMNQILLAAELAEGLDPFEFPMKERQQKRVRAILEDDLAVGGEGIKLKSVTKIWLDMPDVETGAFPVKNILDDQSTASFRFFVLWIPRAPAHRPDNVGYVWSDTNTVRFTPKLSAWGRGEHNYGPMHNYCWFPVMVFTNGQPGIPPIATMGVENARGFVKGKRAPYQVDAEFYFEVIGATPAGTPFNAYLVADIVRIVYRDEGGKILSDAEYPRIGKVPGKTDKPSGLFSK